MSDAPRAADDFLVMHIRHLIPGTLTLHPVGEIDIATAPLLDKALVEALASAPMLVTVDLTEVTFMDSSGLNLLAMTLRRLRGSPTLLTVHAPHHSPARRVLDLSGLGQHFHLTPT